MVMAGDAAHYCSMIDSLFLSCALGVHSTWVQLSPLLSIETWPALLKLVLLTCFGSVSFLSGAARWVSGHGE